jgi:hypothetical protein
MTRGRSVSFIAVALGTVLGTLGIVGASAAPPATADATAVMARGLAASHRRPTGSLPTIPR